MTSPLPKRLLLLAGISLLLAGILIARWLSGWGLVTIHVKDAPLEKVLSSIARQGHARVETSMDGAKKVSLDCDAVSPAEALDIVAARTESSCRVVYLAAPTKEALNGAVLSLRGNGKVDDWKTRYYPTPGGTGPSGMQIDPRSLELTIEGPDMELPQLLDQVAQKTGVSTIAPKDWAPTVPSLPKPNRVGKSIAAMVKSVHGRVEELFFLSPQGRRTPPPDQDATKTTEDEGANRPSGDPFAGLNQQGGRMNPAWREQRAQAQIKKLPASEQPAAQKELDEMKAVFAELRDLPREERRAKWEELMSQPKFAERMENRQMARDSRQTPEQRINRAVNYLERKATMKSASTPGQ
jgi:hypothetical protein